MKIKAIIASLGLTLTATGALAAGLVSSQNASRARATTDPVSGTTLINLKRSIGEYKYVDNNAKFAIYYWNNEENGWSSFSAISSSDVETYFVSYNLSFTPTNMKLVRFPSDAVAPSFDNKWNEAGNLAFADVLCLSGWTDNYSNWVDSLSSTSGLTNDFKLDSYKEDDDNGPYGVSYKLAVSFAENDSFKISWKNNMYTNIDLKVAGSFAVEGGNIVCKTPGIYDLYFKHLATPTLWIQPEAGDAARIYAERFMSAFTCDDGAHEPNFVAGNSWSDLESRWTSDLTDGARANFNVTPDEDGTLYQKVVARYKAVIEHWGTAKYSDFMNKGYKGPNESNMMKSVSQNNSAAIIVVSTSVVAISLIAAFLLLKKRKEN